MGKWGNAGTSDIAPDKPFRIFGELDIKFGYRAFFKGCTAGGEEYDAQIHRGKTKAPCMIMQIFPVMEMNWAGRDRPDVYVTTKEDWVRWVRPSIEKATGKKGDAALEAIENKYVAAEYKPNGRKWNTGDIGPDGKPIFKDNTVLTILAVFDNEKDCGTACNVYREVDADDDAPPFETDNKADDQRQAGLGLIATLKGIGQPNDAILKAVAGYGLSPDDPEVKALLSA